MGKPSIFSREYEKKMKKRKRNIIVIFLIVVIVIFAIALKFMYYPIDFSHIKQNMQEWIDSDTTSQKEESTTVNNIEKEEVKEEVIVKEPIEKFIDINLISGNVAKAVYIENDNGDFVFTDLKNSDPNVTFDISSSKKQMIVCDINSQITLCNTDGTSKIISDDQYISSNGSVFTKENTLNSNPQYLWNVNPKFINEENIAFVTNRPYFGSAAVNQYLWITNINDGNYKICWELTGQNIEICEKDEKGIKITVDGNIHYVGEDGNIIE